MKLIIEIKDNKAASLLEILNSLPFVKTKKISDEKAQILGELKDAVDEAKLIRQGKLKGIAAKTLLDEL